MHAFWGSGRLSKLVVTGREIIGRELLIKRVLEIGGKTGCSDAGITPLDVNMSLMLLINMRKLETRTVPFRSIVNHRYEFHLLFQA